MSSESATAARMPAGSSSARPQRHGQGHGRPHGQAHGLAGLIDVLDRAEAAGPVRRPQVRRASAHRSSGARAGAVRTVPLRSVQPAPMARRPLPRVLVLPEPERMPVTRLSDVFRRAAMWGPVPAANTSRGGWPRTLRHRPPAAPGGCAPSSAARPSGAPVPRASTSPGAGPPGRRGRTSIPRGAARDAQHPLIQPAAPSPLRRCFPAIRRRRPAREELRRSPRSSGRPRRKTVRTA
ncbi:hypothetical protein [Blastococcus brunescens]|uniref:Uncharacterized protein n=1 Tax=Blastococcus brunescens TaxID=1564165 RepID=A0ABZ1B4B0_9ACTN|nr:hypothetical protein [Blastococcus sp. BMG 8361]WRL63895.1 hypothetical protein U6N30_30520 [Blastococcus sp. BMG 8361]